MKTIIIDDESQAQAQLSDAQKDEIIQHVIKTWSTYETARLEQLNDIEVIRKLIYQSYPTKIEYGKQYTLPDMYELQDTLLSHLSENVYFSNESLFEVEGRDAKSNETAQAQKSAIVSDLDSMNFKRIIESANEDFTVSGEYIFFVTYEENKKKRRAKKSDLRPIINGQAEPEQITKLKQMFPFMSKMMAGDQEIEGYLVEKTGDIITSENLIKMNNSHVFYEVSVYEGTKVIPLKSTDFVFDVQKSDRIADANKIWRQYLTVDEIYNNQNFTVDSEDKSLFDDLKNVSETTGAKLRIWHEYVPYAQDVIGNQVQVYNFYGDINLEDGTELKNYIISVSRGRIIRCEPNPYFIDPFVYYAPIVEPDYRRGISPLRVGVIFNAIRSNISNTLTDALRLVVNPPQWAVKGQVEDRIIQLEPGRRYEYAVTESPQPPMPMDFSRGIQLGSQVLQFFENSTESATGLTKNLGGAVEQQDRTATEITYAQQAASTRLAYLTDRIKRNVNIPLVEKIADFKSIFEEDDTVLNIKAEDGSQKDVVIDSLVRNGKYKYTYLDDKSAAEIQQKFDKFVQWAELFVPTGIPDMQEVWKRGLEQLAVKDPDKLTNFDPVDQVASGIVDNSDMPDEQKPEVKKQLKQQAAGLLQQYMQSQQMGAMPNAQV